jgi:hypothetical protein
VLECPDDIKENLSSSNCRAHNWKIINKNSMDEKIKNTTLYKNEFIKKTQIIKRMKK